MNKAANQLTTKPVGGTPTMRTPPRRLIPARPDVEQPERPPRHRAGDVLAELAVTDARPLDEELFTIAVRADGDVLLTPGPDGDVGQAKLAIERVRDDAITKAWPLDCERTNSTSIPGDAFEPGDAIRVRLLRDLDAPLQVIITKRELS